MAEDRQITSHAQGGTFGTVTYPSTPFLMLVLLRKSAENSTGLDDVMADLTRFVTAVDPKDPESLLPTQIDDDATLRERLSDSIQHLREAGLLTIEGTGWFSATSRGRQLLEQNPRGIDDTVLERFVEFRRFLAREREAAGPTEPTRDYKTGFNQYQDGSSLAENPFDAETASYQEWNLGWFEAFEEHLDHHKDGQHFPHSGQA